MQKQMLNNETESPCGPPKTCNPNSDAYWQNLDYKKRPKKWKKIFAEISLRNLSHSDLSNPNHVGFWIARGYCERPIDWKDKFRDMYIFTSRSYKWHDMTGGY